MKDCYIFTAKRTPIGSFLGQLSSVSAPQLGAVAAKAAIGSLRPEEIQECIMGCVLTAGLGQAPARQVAIFSGLPNSVPAITLNKVCGSGLKAVTLAADRLALDRSQVILAGGMESMSQAPFLVKNARSGFKMGHQEMVDGMIHDGLWDVYNQFHMGVAAELCVKEYRFSREEQDQFAKESYERALRAIQSGEFKPEIAEVPVKSRKQELLVSEDEEPFRADLEKMSSLKPVFDKSGSVTAANASSLNDGAAALILSNKESLGGLKPMAKILHQAEFAQKPEAFTTAPVFCVKKLLEEASLKVSDIKVFEINEAFAAVAMAAQKDLEISRDQLNPRGGAVALGHPIGASGARLLTSLLYQLEPGEKGVVSLCIGGGEAIAVLVERL
ncbi:MAG: thiolase family protein [Bradymonadales bacterium]|nr:MAG: thiolase family protein [Bradymonadales bacterium]